MNVTSVMAAYGSQVQGVKDNARSGKTENAKPAAPKEQVQISDTSKEMQAVREAIKKATDVRVELVVEIKRKVTSGNYPLSENLTAAIDRMVKEKILG